MRRPGDADTRPAVCMIVAVAVFMGAVLAGGSALGYFNFIYRLVNRPAEFPTCRGHPPVQGEAVVLDGNCYSSTSFPPLDNDTYFCHELAANTTLIWNGACIDGYVPPTLASLGSPSVLANETALRGIRGNGLLAVVETATHLDATVPLPTSAGGTSLVADAANNVFLGLEAAGVVQLGTGAGTNVVRDVPWERGEVGAIGIENVDAFVGETLYSRRYETDGREYGDARGAIYVRYTDAGRLTVLQLQIGIVAPLGSGPGWIGPGAVGCVLKDFRPGSIATTIFAAAAFSHDDSLPYLWFMSPTDFGGGTTVECTFEMAYMFEL